MTRFTLLAMTAGVLLLTTDLPAGGWAVSTVEHLPDHAVAGAPVRLTFAIRQHGISLATGLEARAEAVLGSRRVTADAQAAKTAGRYTAVLTLPAAGEWTIAVGSWNPTSGNRWGETRFTLPVIEPGGTPAATRAVDRGAQLFAAKGCVSCHRHEAVAGASMAIGPALTGRQYPPDVLTAWLEAPRPCGAGRPCMPNLELTPPEIAALAAFFNAPAAVKVATAR